MRLSRTTLHKAVAGVAFGTGLAAINSANAGLVYDLRFAAGAQPTGTIGAGVHSLGATPGTYHLELWARVSGTNGTTTDEALSNSYLSVASTQVGGAAVTAGGLANGTTQAPFNDATTSRNGAANNITADGLGDWGGTGTRITDTNYMFARTAVVGGTFGGDGTGQAVDANTWEFKLATFDLTVTSVGSTGETHYDVMRPIASKTGGGITNAIYASYTHDNVADQVDFGNFTAQATYSGSTGVVLTLVPEPASIGLLGAAAVGLLARRRRN